MNTEKSMNKKRIIVAALFLVTGLIFAIAFDAYGKNAKYKAIKENLEKVERTRLMLQREAHIQEMMAASTKTRVEKVTRVAATISTGTRVKNMESPLKEPVEEDLEEEDLDEETLEENSEDENTYAEEAEEASEEIAEEESEEEPEETAKAIAAKKAEKKAEAEAAKTADEDEEAEAEAKALQKAKAKAAAAKAAEESEEPEAEEPAEEEQQSEVESGEYYSSSDLQFMGEIYSEGHRWTWYSQNVLPGGGLNIPGRHVDENGYVCDGNGRICLASGDYGYGTVVPTPFGKEGCVYDSGCDSGTLDVYVDF